MEVIADTTDSILGKRKGTPATYGHLEEFTFNISKHCAQTEKTIIKLTESGSAWLEIEQLPSHLVQYSNENFAKLFDLHPKKKGKIVMNHGGQCEESCSARWHHSYLNTPKRMKDNYGSYMFCGLNEESINDSLPDEFKVFHKYINSIKGHEYNQVVANWYEKGSHHLPFHSDHYTENMVDNYNIVSISLNNPKASKKSKCRVLTFKAKASKRIGVENDTLFRQVNVVQSNGCIVTMCGDTQVKFSHGIKKVLNEKVHSRINLSFREFKHSEILKSEAKKDVAQTQDD